MTEPDNSQQVDKQKPYTIASRQESVLALSELKLVTDNLLSIYAAAMQLRSH